MGRGQGGRVRPRRSGRRRRGARSGGDGSVRGDRPGRARAPPGPRLRTCARAGACHESRDRRRARCGPGARDRRRGDPGRRARPPEARHRHGPLGARRAGHAGPRGGRADEPFRLGGLGCRIHRATDRTVQRGDGALPAPDPPHREQRGRTSLSLRAIRRRSLRDRALRHLALRHRPDRGRARAGAPLGLRARPGQAAAAGGVDRLRPAVDRRAPDLDRDRPGRVRGRLQARPDRDRGARRRRAAPGGRHDLDGRVRSWSSTGSSRWEPR